MTHPAGNECNATQPARRCPGTAPSPKHPSLLKRPEGSTALTATLAHSSERSASAPARARPPGKTHPAQPTPQPPRPQRRLALSLLVRVSLLVPTTPPHQLEQHALRHQHSHYQHHSQGPPCLVLQASQARRGWSWGWWPLGRARRASATGPVGTSPPLRCTHPASSAAPACTPPHATPQRHWPSPLQTPWAV